MGSERLSPHDARHYWAAQAIRNGIDIKNLQDAGGWTSPAMPLRHAESAAIGCEGIRWGSQIALFALLRRRGVRNRSRFSLNTRGRIRYAGGVSA